MKSLFHVYPGCIVRVYFYHYLTTEKREFELRVLAVHDRPFMNPLITAIDPASGVMKYDPKKHHLLTEDNGFEVHVFDLHYVTGIISHEKEIHQPEEIKPHKRVSSKTKGIWRGPLIDLIEEAMLTTKMHRAAWAYLDMAKAYILFEKNGLGKIGHVGFFYVRKKNFKKWVQANWHRLLVDKKHALAEHIASEKELDEISMMDDDYLF